MNKNILIWICMVLFLVNIVFASPGEYYNMSLYEDDETMIDMYYTTDVLLNGYFSLFLVLIVISLPAIVMIKNNNDIINSIHTSSLFGLLFAIFIYIGQAVYTSDATIGLYIFIPSIIYGTTLAIKWYHK